MFEHYLLEHANEAGCERKEGINMQMFFRARIEEQMES